MNQFEQLIQTDIFHWEQLSDHLSKHGITKTSDGRYLESIKKLVLASSYATAQLAKNPNWITALKNCSPFNLQAQILQESLEQLTDIDEIKKQLRLYRHQKMVEIIFLDVCLNNPIENTLLHLSDLADLLIQQAVLKAESHLSKKHDKTLNENGNQIQLNIIAMGKLGGQELNFSSDIDLICTFSEEGQLKGYGQLSFTEYFTRVVRLFKQLLHENTEHGFVYRVDFRLRPWGDSGPIVLSHSALEHYYLLHGREWEQYAMVKARLITGSEQDKSDLNDIIQPFVYRRYHDYRVFDGLASLKKKIDQQALKQSGSNLKTGQGGIREIEFFVQAFQILQGGRNKNLQTSSIYQAFDVLIEQKIVDVSCLKQLRQAYNFLRLLENRLQMYQDKQTHLVPDNETQQQRLSITSGFENWSDLLEKLQQHQSRVNQHFIALFQGDRETSSESDRSTDYQLEDLVASLNFNNGDSILEMLEKFSQGRAYSFMSAKAQQRYTIFLPGLLTEVATLNDQQICLQRILTLLSSMAGRSIYFELLYQNMPVLQRLVLLFDQSEWIAQEVARYPMLLESIILPTQLSQRFDTQTLQQELERKLKNVAGDTELELDVLRQFKRSQTLIIAAAELSEDISADETCSHLSDLAEMLLNAVYDLAWRALTQQHGKPQSELDGEIIYPELAIIGYGKLGSRELHYQSDLDVVFLHNSCGSKQQTDGAKSLQNSMFFGRLAQKIISLTSVLTAAGKLYEIDARLRPDGSSGLLVSSLDAFQTYQQDKAWTWEHQALVRARFVAGSSLLESSFVDIRQQVLCQSRDTKKLQQDVVEMRNKLYQNKTDNNSSNKGEISNIKHSKGCLIDIEFMVQFWVLALANKNPSICVVSDNIPLINELVTLKLIPKQNAQLIAIYQTYHQWLHRQVLQQQPATIKTRLIESEIAVVTACWKNTFST